MARPPFAPRQRPPRHEPAPAGPPVDERLASVVAWGHYVDGRRSTAASIDDASHRARSGEGFVWLGLKEPTDADLSRFAAQFDLHPLAVEDAVEGHTRSKLEQFGDTLFMVMSTIDYVLHDRVTATSEIIITGQIMVFVGRHFVLTVRKGEHAELGALRADLEADPERLARGPWTVLYAIADKVVDDYAEVAGELGDDVDEVEAQVFARQGQHEVQSAYQLKRELIEFKRTVLPLGLPLQMLASRDFPVVPDEAKAYFRELADHHAQARETVASYDEVLISVLQAGLAQISLSDNEDMRKISAWVAIVAVPTMIAGIYGMNFDYMPELRWRYGYFMVLALMAGLMIALYVNFKKRKWL